MEEGLNGMVHWPDRVPRSKGSICSDSLGDGEDDMEEGLNSMAHWPDRVPRSFPGGDLGSKSSNQPTQRSHRRFHQGWRLTASVALLHRPQAMRQRSLSASTPTPCSPVACKGYESECSTNAEDLTTTAALSCLDSGSEMGNLSGEPIAVKESHLVSL